MMTSVRSGAPCVVAVFLALILVGCSENNGKNPKIQRVEGVAKVIDLENNYVSMTIKDKKGVERELTGTVREDTEVSINGRKQDLKDVKPGDKVVVYGYREGKDEDQKLVATKVEVTRVRDDDWKSTSRTMAGKPDQHADEPKVTAKPAGEPEAKTVAADDEEIRNQTTDMIYARIRIEMESAISKRAALLKGGKAPSDPEVRQLEGVIMRARDLLQEAGEVLEDIEPPIVEKPQS
ncbi:MAG: hypothetical protein JXQ73_29525 [Phycisphaerae bacterium]|nr:hypothetical protein [Phycisphaerae bacterium]